MENQTSTKQEFVTLTALREDYCLSTKWIERLGPPDHLKRNPIYRSASPMKLWLKERVEDFLEQHDVEYEQHLVRREHRSKRAKDVAARKHQETIEYARSVEIRLYRFPKNLTKVCLMHLSDLSLARGWFDMPHVTETTIVNMLRHEYSNYEFLLASLYRRIGRWEAYPIIKDRVNKAVCEKAGMVPATMITTYSDDKFVENLWGESRGGES